ncbi:hypothetical protein DH2020_049523 [Rehmannia glutinosa]|uniref:Uncharacterized protein n=1 Tax=Rehmannia glutinosa TaxID=99300 RepID=A0ABR0U2I0_REHGL
MSGVWRWRKLRGGIGDIEERYRKVGGGSKAKFGELPARGSYVKRRESLIGIGMQERYKWDHGSSGDGQQQQHTRRIRRRPIALVAPSKWISYSLTARTTSFLPSRPIPTFDVLDGDSPALPTIPDNISIDHNSNKKSNNSSTNYIHDINNNSTKDVGGGGFQGSQSLPQL